MKILNIKKNTTWIKKQLAQKWWKSLISYNYQLQFNKSPYDETRDLI